MEIEYGIPIPPEKRTPKNNWGEIPIGASTFVAGMTKRGATSSTARFSKANGGSFIVDDAQKNGVWGARVGRIS